MKLRELLKRIPPAISRIQVVYAPEHSTERGTISGRKLIHRRERGDFRVNQGSPILV